MRMIIEYNDDICCDNAEIVVEDEIVDTYGGDYTSADTYSCNKCKRAFMKYNSGRFDGVEEIEYQEDKNNY